MIKHKIFIKMLLSTLCLITLTSWQMAPISRQKTPQDYSDKVSKIRELKKEEQRIAREQRAVKHDLRASAHLAHQKNRLAQFVDRDGYIWFYDEDNKHTYFLSNAYPTSVRMWNMKFRCAEAAFQASKFAHKPDVAKRFTHLDGEEAAKLAQKWSYQQRQDWYQVRENLMLDVLRAKFQQNPDLGELLRATGDAYLVDHTKEDAFWADGGDGKGKNRLGHLLMQVRGETGGIGSVSKPRKYRSFVN